MIARCRNCLQEFQVDDRFLSMEDALHACTYCGFLHDWRDGRMHAAMYLEVSFQERDEWFGPHLVYRPVPHPDVVGLDQANLLGLISSVRQRFDASYSLPDIKKG